MYVNLVAGSIDGKLLSSTEPVSLLDGFDGTVNFFFSTPVTVTPGVQYFFEPVQAPTQFTPSFYIIESDMYNYPGGSLYNNGSNSGQLGFQDLWFREGIETPEPSSYALVLLGGGALVIFRRMKAKPNPSS